MGFIWRHLVFVINFCSNRNRVLGAVNVWFCCLSFLVFLIMANLHGALTRRFSKFHWSPLIGIEFFIPTPVIFEKILEHSKILKIVKFSIPSSSVRQLRQKCGWAGSDHYMRTGITEPPCFKWCHFSIMQNDWSISNTNG